MIENYETGEWTTAWSGKEPIASFFKKQTNKSIILQTQLTYSQ